MSNIHFPQKPSGAKNYGHIAHLPSSRMGPSDHKLHEGQATIATVKTRDFRDLVIVQEKLDGSNVGVYKREGRLYPLTRSGYPADSSNYEQHWRFANWVYENSSRFFELLEDGERLCGEWLMQAHGTRYELQHEPFVAFDIMLKTERKLYEEFSSRIAPYDFVKPYCIHNERRALSVENALKLLGEFGKHGALDPIEGAVWRVERRTDKENTVDFLTKYVRSDKEDGKYLPEISGKDPVWNWRPSS